MQPNCSLKMGSWRNHLLLFLSHINVVGLTTSEPSYLYKICIPQSGNYTSNSVYQTNLNALLSNLSSNIDEYGFYSSSFGRYPDTVHAIALCRGDLHDLDACRHCINNVTSKLPPACPNKKEAVAWFDPCMLRYSNEPFIGTVTTYPYTYVYNVDASSVLEFNQALRRLLDSLQSRAAWRGTRCKCATGNVTGPDFQSIYGMMQCTPDLSEKDCSNCLQEAIAIVPGCCGGKIGGRVYTPSCFLRFEPIRFFDEIPADAPPPSPSPGNNDNTTRTVIIVVVSITTSVIVLIVCVCRFSRKRKQQNKRKQKFEISEVGDESITVESLQYNFETISIATDNFSDANKLGQGGFGPVYKGRLPNGQEIAVKRLSSNSGQGKLEFKNEVILVAKLQHRNLVRLLGFCLEGKERLLVYEFVTNSSLDHFIYDPIKRAHLGWDRCYKIIGGIARGLLYLHEDSRLRIIHRDLKAGNVLLDAEMNPKISDFGMARLFVMDETQGSTNRIVGTYGYMAPEYAMHGHFSVKSDVFSFGVLVLEIMCGQKNNNFRNGENVEDLLSYAWKSWREGTASNLIDSSLRANLDSMREMMRCIHIGLLCVQEKVAERPTMASVVLMLSSLSFSLGVPSEPAFFLHSKSIHQAEDPLLQAHSSGPTGSTPSVNEVSISELYPR